MMKNRFRLTFTGNRVTDPTLCQVAKKFDVTFSIRRADVKVDMGWIDLEFTGDDDEMARVMDYLKEQGVRVDPIGGDVLVG